MGTEILCSKCDKPLSSKYWLNLFHDDGREEKILNGKEPTQGGFVAVYVDVECRSKRTRSGEEAKLRMQEAVKSAVRKKSMPKVERSEEVIEVRNLLIRRKGSRILMVMPRIS